MVDAMLCKCQRKCMELYMEYNLDCTTARTLHTYFVLPFSTYSSV